jgi:anti-sigma factor RsiW
MTCPMQKGNPELLVQFAAGELDADATLALEGHLAECDACRARAAEHRAVWHALDIWEAPPVSADFDRLLYRRIDAEARSSWWERMVQPFRAMPLRQLVPLTAITCLLMVGVLLERPGVKAPVAPRPATVRIDQVERTLDDMELLGELSDPQPAPGTHTNAM